MADLAQHKKKRASARGWVTKAVNYLEEIIELPDNEVDRIDLEAAIAEFDSRLSALDEVQLLVEMNLPDEDSMCADLDEAAEIRNRAKKIVIKINIHWGNPPPKSDDASSTSSASTSRKLVTLPKLVLPKFSGEIIQWQSFWD